MTIQPQIHPIVDFGTPAEFAAQRIEEAGIISVDTADVVSITRLNLTRLVIGGTGANVAKYYVNVAGSIPATGFTSVQTAINQAATDLHTAANPAVIICYPGRYTENLTMLPGISVQGMVADIGDGTVVTTAVVAGCAEIVGSIDLSLASASRSALAYVRVIGNITAGGVAVVSCVFDNVSVRGAAGVALPAMLITNSNFNLVTNRCWFVASTPTEAFSVIGTPVVFGIDTVISSDLADTSQTSLKLSGGAFDVQFRGSRVFGRTSVATGTLLLTDSRTETSGASEAFLLATGGTVNMSRGAIHCAAPVMVTGTGVFNQLDVAKSNVSGTVATTVTTTPVSLSTHLVRETVIAPGGAMATLDEAFTVTAVAGNTTMTLLTLNVVPQGYECSIKKVSDGNAVVVGRAGADTIDGQISVTLAATTQGAVTLRAAGGVAPTWRIVGSYGLVTCP